MTLSLLKKTTGWVLFILLFAGSQLNAANNITLNAAGSNSLTVILNTFQQLQVSNTISSFNTLWLNTEKGEFVEISAPSYSKSNVAGAPQLPVISRMIEIPAGATARVKVISYELKEYKLSDFGITQRLLPAQLPQPKSGDKVAFSYNKQLYESNRFYGEELARVEVAGYLRSVKLANLVISPVEYNPVTNTIRVYNNLVVEIRFDGADRAEASDIKARTRSAYFSSIFRDVLNNQPSDAPLDTISTVPVKYVIVADPMFQEALQSFIHWKIKRGFQVIEAYTNNPAVGNTFVSIKAYLQNLYASATATDPAPTFVLLVGDVAQIPAYNCGEHVSDLYYCEYTGDYLPEVYYGRFSANNVSELMPQINKTLQYEQYLMPDPSYLNEVVMAAGSDPSYQLVWGNGQINYGTTYYFNAAHNLVSHTYLQPEPGGGNYSQNIRNNVSNGVSYANYTAHGSPDGWANPGFSISQVAALQNKDKYCLMVGNCCQTNTFNQNTFGEVLLRAVDKGALGYIGATDYSYWDEDYWWGVGNGPIVTNPTYETSGLGAYDRTFHDHGEPRSEWYSTMDQMVFAGNLAVQASNSGLKRYYWEIYCLMGDPSTMVYFSVPPPMTVDYMPFLPLGTPTFEVQTEPYAYIAISKNNILHSVAEADQNGYAYLSLQPFTEAGYASIVVTKQNREPYIDSVLVASPNGPYLVLDSYLVKDNGGNNNQTPEYNEPLTVDLAFNNYGNTNAMDAVTTLTSGDTYLSIPGSAYTWPLIPSNGSAAAADALSIDINEYVPDMHTASFTVSTQVDTNTFTSQFNIQIKAPKLVNSQITISDVDHGNGNGRIDPGETINVQVIATNTGHCASSAVTTSLFVIGNFVTSNSPVVNLGILAPGASGTANFSFTVSQAAPVGAAFAMYVVSEAGVYNAVSALSPLVGLQLEDFETGNFQKYSWSMAGNKPWTITTANKSEGTYSARSGEINNAEKSEMFIEGQVFTTDSISFFRKVSSQSGHDFLRFYVDGIEFGNWSGNKDWARVSYLVPAGNHRFTWAYEKDSSTLVPDDAVWVDYIKFPPFGPSMAGPLAVNSLAVPATICKGDQSQLYAFATGGTGVYSYQWTPAIALSNTGIFNPLASPAETTTYNVEFLDNISIFGTVTVTVEQPPQPPVASVISDHLVSSVTQGNQWYNYQGIIPGATSQIYTPTSTNAYYVTTTNAAGCESAASNSVFYGFTGIQPEAGNGISVYPNPFTGRVYVNYNLNSESHIKISVFNALGNEVAVIEDGEKAGGIHQSVFDGSALPAGVYYCKLFSGNNVQVVKLVKNK